jgi:predicted nuclease of predicted toxin-antitoxin system
MRLYLDDDCAGKLLLQLLRNAGHDVQVPADVGLIGRKDAVHLRNAIRDNRAIVTRNYQDFEDLHEVLMEGKDHHPPMNTSF